MEKLKFKKDGTTAHLSDTWYDLTIGGYLLPEDFLEQEDAKKVQNAIDLISQYLDQGVEEGVFDDTM